MAAEITLEIAQTKPIPLKLALSLKRGEFLALVGPSGAGKTTFLRMLAGLAWPEQGFIQIGTTCCLNTQTGVRLSPRERPVGMVFQNYALFPHLNALENVEMALQALPRKQRQTQAAVWLERMHLSHRQKSRPHSLSGGEMQRLALARALAREPQLLLLDEPFAAIDQALRKQLYLELALWRDALNLSLILVTHEIQEALAFADQMALMQNGRLLQVGPAKQIQFAPSHPDVVKILGHENLFAVTGAGPGELNWQEGKLKWVPNSQESVSANWAWIPASEIILREEITAISGPNVFSAHVVSCQRLGQNWHLALTLPQGSRVSLSWPRPLALGQAVSIYLPETALRCL